MIGFVTLGMSLWEGKHMTHITLICLSLFIAFFTMMLAAEVGQRRRRRHYHSPPAEGHN
jgi:hypothetical protein